MHAWAITTKSIARQQLLPLGIAAIISVTRRRREKDLAGSESKVDPEKRQVRVFQCNPTRAVKGRPKGFQKINENG